MEVISVVYSCCYYQLRCRIDNIPTGIVVVRCSAILYFTLSKHPEIDSILTIIRELTSRFKHQFYDSFGNITLFQFLGVKKLSNNSSTDKNILLGIFCDVIKKDNVCSKSKSI